MLAKSWIPHAVAVCKGTVSHMRKSAVYEAAWPSSAADLQIPEMCLPHFVFLLRKDNYLLEGVSKRKMCSHFRVMFVLYKLGIFPTGHKVWPTLLLLKALIKPSEPP